jgi:hypothetical protein
VEHRRDSDQNRAGMRPTAKLFPSSVATNPCVTIVGIKHQVGTGTSPRSNLQKCCADIWAPSPSIRGAHGPRDGQTGPDHDKADADPEINPLEVWENWKEPATGDWVGTFAIITTDANSLVAEIHDRMPLILSAAEYERWLSDEPDPRDLMQPFPAEPMRMWPISTRVNKPENDDQSILEPIELATDAA